MECVVEFEYDANEDDELTLNKGDIISNVTHYEDGWMKGVLRGKEGVFPDNFVKVIKPDTKVQEKTEPKTDNFRKSQEDLTAPTKKAKNSNATLSGQKARVIHKYAPQQKDELALEMGATIEIMESRGEEEDEGWMRGMYNGRVGLFPANFVTLLSPGSSRRQQPAVQESNESSHTTGQKKVVGVGFGNIFTGEPIQLKTTSVKEVKRDTDDSVQAPKLVPRPNRSGLGTSTNTERVIVKYPYKSENPDELTIEKGDIITIIDKNLEDDGWWKGELNGKIGVFPDNFVEAFPIGSSLAKEDKSKPSRPAPPLPSEKPNASDKFGVTKKSGPPPIIAKKPSASKASTNGRTSIDTKGDGVFDNLPDHQPLQTLTSDRPRIANKRLPSKEFLRASGGKDGVLKGSNLSSRQSVDVEEEASAEKEEEKTVIKKEPPPPRPMNRPANPVTAPIPSQNSSNSALLSKTTTSPLQTSSKANFTATTPAPVVSHPTEPSVSPADLTELRRIFDNRLSQEVSEIRAEMERMRMALTTRIHSLTAEIDEEKRMRHSAQVELERVRRLLQERELTPTTTGGTNLPHQSHSSA